MLAAQELHREWAFTYRRETETGAQLLQGVIDCCFIERGAWVLVDYKTDADAAGAIERHRPQLELYAQALAGHHRPARSGARALSGARGKGVSGVRRVVGRLSKQTVLNLFYNPRRFVFLP